MIVRKFKTEDLNRLIIQPEQQDEFVVAKPNFNFTIEADNTVLGVFGILQTGADRLCVSSFISTAAGKYMIPFIKVLKKLLEDGMAKTGNKFMDMSVLADFENGKRLAALLGFSFNQKLPSYFKGKDYELYTRRFNK